MWNIKFALKSLKKSFSITFINIFGFSLGLCATFFLIQYLLNEYSYDTFHIEKERIFRIAVKNFKENNFTDESYVYTSEAGSALKADFPEIDQYVTISYPKNDIFYFDNSPIKIEDYIYSSSSIFNLFSFHLLEGDPETVLKDPFSVVLTKNQSTKIFNNQNPVGKQCLLNDDLYTITGIAEDPPKNSHIRFNMLVSMSTRYKQKNVYMGWNGGNQYIHFVKLVPGAAIVSLNEKMPSFMWKYINKDYEQFGIKDELYLQPLSEIHLHYNPYSDALRQSMLVFSLIAVLLLVVVIINFINLFIADSGKHLKTMGILKIHGAGKFKMIKYVLTEIAILISFSIFVALILNRFFHPIFEQLAGKSIPVFTEFGFIYSILLIIVVIIVSLFAALLPTLIISSVQPTQIIKNKLVIGKSGSVLKNGLVVFQFFVSILLIISALTIQNQNRYLQKFDLGYNKENVIIFPLQTGTLQQKTSLLKEQILKLSGVEKISAVSEVPYDGLTSNGYFPEGKTSPEMIHVVDVDEDFFGLLNIAVLRGNGFSKESTSDDQAYLINEAFVREIGWENPLGKIIHRSTDHKVIGVVKDFNFASLRNNIKPLIITNKPDGGFYNYLLVKTSAGNFFEIINQINQKWKEVAPGSPFEYSFLDQKFEQVYRSELSIQKLLKSFSLLTIFIALLGLLGISKYSIDSRIKEIGVRKVNGASIKEILILLNKTYVILIVVAFIAAAPVAGVAMYKWLENFAYKTSLSWWIFALAGLLALGIALLTVSWQSWRAATRNPVEALRYE